MQELRRWQRDAKRIILSDKPTVLINAFPATGKTRPSLEAAKEMLDTGRIDQVVVVVHTTHLSEQWKANALQQGIQLRSALADGPVFHRDFQGCVVTYQALAREVMPSLFAHAIGQGSRTMVILDELHHAGGSTADDSTKYGRGVLTAFAQATKRVLLTGTPWRQDRTSIPWVTYNANGVCVADITYGYGQAVVDEVIRQVTFQLFNGNAEWVDDSRRESADISDEGLTDRAASISLNMVLNPTDRWVRTVVERAHSALTEKRSHGLPNAGGIVFARSREHAQALVPVFRRISGCDPVLVMDGEEDNTDKIRSFTRGTTPWLITVKMVSEGVDIPRLAVGVFLTNYTTPLYLRQCVGRVTRRSNPADETTADFFIPATEKLRAHAASLREELSSQLAESTDQAAREGVLDENRTPSLVIPLTISDAEFDGTIENGQHWTQAEHREADVLMARFGASNKTAILQYGRESRGEPLLDVPQDARAPESNEVLMRTWRTQVNALVNQVAYKWYPDDNKRFTTVNMQIKHQFGDRKSMSISQLENLAKWLQHKLTDD